MQHLQHSNIVQVFEIGEEEGLPFFSLEYVDGQGLDTLYKDEPASPHEAARIIAELSEAMQYAHDQGIIHRDIKPANVLMSKEGVTKITDFGLAKQVQDDNDQEGTKTGTILGTPGYMSPEQALGKINEMNHTADQYSLGALLYRLVSGRAPFVSSRAMDTLMQVIKLEPVPLQQLSPDVPLDLETICLKTLTKDPAGRYENCQALADDLNRFIKNEPIVARPISRFEKLTRWCKRNPKIAGLVGTTFFLLAAIAGLMSWSSFAIATERDNVQIQKKKADDNLVTAIQNEKQAIANEEIARDQALKIVKTMQSVLTDIDGPLSVDPKFAKTRLEVMKSMSDTYNDLEIELHTDVKSQAIPTFMAIRYQLTKIFESLSEGKLAHEEIKKLYQLAKDRIKVKEGTDATRKNLAEICLMHVTITEKAEGIEASQPLLDEALSVARDIIANPKRSEEPGTPPLYALNYTLSNALQSYGVYHYNRGELDKAAPCFIEAGQVRNAILDSLKDDEEFLEKPEAYQKLYSTAVAIDGRRSSLGAATILFKMGDTEKALKQFEEVFDRTEKAYANDPTEKNEREVSGMGVTYAYNCMRVGKLDKASGLFVKSEEVAKKYATKNPDDYDSQYKYSVALYRHASLLESEGRDEAKSRFAKCVEIREDLVSKDPNLKNETMLMVAYARNGNAEKALKIANRLNKNEELEGKMRVDIARAYIQASRFVDDANEKELLVKKSLTTLQKVITGGYSDWFELETESDLEPLRENDEFKAIIAKLK